MRIGGVSARTGGQHPPIVRWLPSRSLPQSFEIFVRLFSERRCTSTNLTVLRVPWAFICDSIQILWHGQHAGFRHGEDPPTKMFRPMVARYDATNKNHRREATRYRQRVYDRHWREGYFHKQQPPAGTLQRSLSKFFRVESRLLQTRVCMRLQDKGMGSERALMSVCRLLHPLVLPMAKRAFSIPDELFPAWCGSPR